MNDSLLLSKKYELIFYFFIPPDPEFVQSDAFLEVLKLLEYIFDKKCLPPEKYAIFICGETNAVSKVDFLCHDMDFKFVKPVIVNQNVYEELSLPIDGQFVSTIKVSMTLQGTNIAIDSKNQIYVFDPASKYLISVNPVK